MASIRLEGVSKEYSGGHRAVAGLDLAVADGELLVLVGPSGCGKSTALRLVAGLEVPSSGRVLIDDRDVTALPPQDRDLAMVFQSYALYPHKTVAENLAFPLRIRRVPAAEVARRVAEVADSLELAELLGRKPGALSGGQRQRVALGRAIIREPRAFLLDEPLSNLDARLRVETRAELSRIHRRLGVTMLYVTHDQEEAMTLGDRIAVLQAGVLQQVAPPLELYRDPVNQFVAGFIGSPAMNFLSCGLERSGPAVVLVGAGFRLPWSRPSVENDAPLLLGIRPRECELATDADCHFEGRIELIEPLGPESIVHLVPAGVGGPERLRVVVAAGPELREGSELRVRFRSDRLLLFDGRTGLRVDRP
jgi:ABC-type sugar transport system ATPase subunit